jgi:hypothetical protein
MSLEGSNCERSCCPERMPDEENTMLAIRMLFICLLDQSRVQRDRIQNRLKALGDWVSTISDPVNTQNIKPSFIEGFGYTKNQSVGLSEQKCLHLRMEVVVKIRSIASATVNENNQGLERSEVTFAFLEDAMGLQARLLKLNDCCFRA